MNDCFLRRNTRRAWCTFVFTMKMFTVYMYIASEKIFFYWKLLNFIQNKIPFIAKYSFFKEYHNSINFSIFYFVQGFSKNELNSFLGSDRFIAIIRKPWNSTIHNYYRSAINNHRLDTYKYSFYHYLSKSNTTSK